MTLIGWKIAGKKKSLSAREAESAKLGRLCPKCGKIESHALDVEKPVRLTFLVNLSLKVESSRRTPGTHRRGKTAAF